MTGNIAVGPGWSKVGSTFNTQVSADWSVGEETQTWSGLRVRIIAKRDLGNFGSWRYEYTFQVIQQRDAREVAR